MNEKSPNNKYTGSKKRVWKRAFLDNGICEICGEEFRACYDLDLDLVCELTWVLLKGKMILACDECKEEVERTE